VSISRFSIAGLSFGGIASVALLAAYTVARGHWGFGLIVLVVFPVGLIGVLSAVIGAARAMNGFAALALTVSLVPAAFGVLFLTAAVNSCMGC
jgi:hypothetical protein